MGILERHADKWMPEPNTGCFIWTGCLTGSRDKRPTVGVSRRLGNGRSQPHRFVARLLCEEIYGPPPTSKHQAAHNTPNGCVGGLCVNGGHLRWATNQENMQDKPPDRRKRGARFEAKAAGLNTYFNGKPCPQGHVGPRYVSGGLCVTCGRARDKRNLNRKLGR
jgi:hypothetical protein